MCYKSPGPRCSANAKNALVIAEEKLSMAETQLDRSVAIERLREAEEQYDATPKGQDSLRIMIEAGKDEHGILSARLEHGIILRRFMLEEIKSEDLGDVIDSIELIV